MDGRAPTLGLLADLGVEARPDHLLAGDDGTRRGVAAWRCCGVGGRLGKDDWEAADGWRGGGGGRIMAEKTTAWRLMCGPD